MTASRPTLTLLLALAAALAGTGCTLPGGRTVRKPKAFQCRRAAGRIVIDGKLEERAWEGAQIVGDFRVPPTGQRPQAPSQARFLWDDQFLYVAATFEDRDITAVKKEHDSMTWHDDVVELFVKPVEMSPVYAEFHVTPIGTTLDLLFGRRGAGHFDRWKAWESGMKAAVSVNGTVNNWRDRDQGWIAEIAIPLAALEQAGPKAQLGDRWRFAVSRYNYSVYVEGGLERTSSAPLSRMDFHYHEDFDLLEFAE